MTTNIKDYSTTQASNISLNGIDTNEGMLPSNLNNALRALMKNTRDWANDIQWFEYGVGSGAYTSAWVSTTQFTIASSADISAIYHVGRRLKVLKADASLVYGSITATSNNGTLQTITATFDSGNLGSSTNALRIYIGALSKTNSSIPTEIIGTSNIANNAITTAKILDNNVTVAKMADNSVDSDQYVDGSIDTAHIANSQITVGKMAANSVDSDQYVDGSIDLIHLSADSVDGTKIANDSINSEHYVDASIDTQHIADSQITLAKLASNSINSSKIVDGSIVNADVNASAAIDATKIADGTVTSTEFQHINTLSSNAQTQLDAKVAKASNLSDLASASTSRSNLGLGTIATQASNSVSISGGSITGLGTPSNNTDAATKVYVDGLVTGLKTRIICRVATTANITTATDLQAGDAIDGVTLAEGDRVLVKNQSTQTQNGIYLTAASGQNAARDPEFDTVAELAGQMVITQEGSAGGDKFFLCTTNSSGSIGSVNITFTTVQPSNVGDVTLNGTQTLTNKTLTDAVAITNSVTGEIVPGKIGGTNFTGSLLVGHATTGSGNSEFNTAVGLLALDALTSGDENSVLGYRSGSAITTGTQNVMIGVDSMQYGTASTRNTAIGYQAGRNISGNDNIVLGNEAGENITSGAGNVIIGSVNAGSATGNRQLIIAGNDESTTTTWISGDSSGNVTVAGTLTTSSGAVAAQADVTALAIALG